MPRSFGMTTFDNKMKNFNNFANICIDQAEKDADIQDKILMLEQFKIVNEQLSEKATKMFKKGDYDCCSSVRVVSDYENSRLRLLRKLKAKRDKKK